MHSIPETLPRRKRLAPLGLALALSLPLLAGGSARAAQAVNRPYLQSVTPTSAVVVFRADQACPAQVRYAAGGGPEQVATSSQAQAQHEIRLEGLTPGTEYRYTVEACGSELEPEHTFRTAPPQGTSKVRFAVLGDFGKGNAAQTSVAEQVQAQDPEVLVTVGDNIYDDGTDAEFTQNFLRPMGALFAEVPLYPAFGNHDYAADDLKTSLKNFVVPTNNPIGTERYYSFDWGNVHFVVLDSICLMGETDNAECDVKQQLAWADSDLKATKAHWKVVLMHNVLFSSAKYGARPEEVGPMREKVLPLVEANGVDIVFSGDDHTYERSKPMRGGAVAPEGTRGVVYAVTGHGAEGRDWAMDQQAWSAYRNNTDVGFMDVRVEGDTLQARMMGADGRVHDSFTLTKPLAPDAPLALTATAQPQRGPAPLDVTLSAQGLPEDAQVTWTLAPGQTASGHSVRHRFEKAGTYSVKAEVKRGEQTATQTVAVTVDAAGTTQPGTQPEQPGGGQPAPPSASPGAPSSPAEAPSGCSAAGGSAVAGLAALLLWQRRRARRVG